MKADHYVILAFLDNGECRNSLASKEPEQGEPSRGEFFNAIPHQADTASAQTNLPSHRLRFVHECLFYGYHVLILLVHAIKLSHDCWQMLACILRPFVQDSVQHIPSTTELLSELMVVAIDAACIHLRSMSLSIKTSRNLSISS